MQSFFEVEALKTIIPWLVGVLVFTLVLFVLVRRVFLIPKEERPKKQPLPESKPTKEQEEFLQAVKEVEYEAVPAKEAKQAPRVEPRVEPAKKVQRVELKDALLNTRSNLLGRIKQVFTGSEGHKQEDFDALEEVLYTSDLGPRTVQKLVESISDKLEKSDRTDFDKVRLALKNEMIHIFTQLNHSSESEEIEIIKSLQTLTKPVVWMIVGVNGAGKTTSIGKLAHAVSQKGYKTMVIAGDTFRAAASDQLQVWSERAQVDIFSPAGVKDPSAVIFDGCTKAKASGYDVIIVDTAGRLHTQENLMEELKKMKRVIQKVLPEAPHEVLIVLDSNSGQNAFVQTEKFNEALQLTGAVLTKLDGTAKGGVAVGLACQYELPIKIIGVGEGIDDLRPFKPKEFVDSIL